MVIELVFHFVSVGFLLFLVFGLSSETKKSKVAKILGSMGANLSIAILLTLRWIRLYHFPISGLYESLLFLAWILLTINIYLFNEHPVPLGEDSQLPFDFGSLILPFILFLDLFALFQLPLTLKISSPLVPALQSNWLLMHVTFMIGSYGFLIAGSLFAISSLVI